MNTVNSKCGKIQQAVLLKPYDYFKKFGIIICWFHLILNPATNILQLIFVFSFLLLSVYFIIFNHLIVFIPILPAIIKIY